MHVALLAVNMWINPLGEVDVSTRIWLNALTSASRWEVDDAKRLQMEMRPWVFWSYLKILSSSRLVSSWVASLSKGLAIVGGCFRTTLSPTDDILNIMCNYLIRISTQYKWRLNVIAWVNNDPIVVDCNGGVSGTNLNGADARESEITPSTS